MQDLPNGGDLDEVQACLDTCNQLYGNDFNNYQSCVGYCNQLVQPVPQEDTVTAEAPTESEATPSVSAESAPVDSVAPTDQA